METMSEGSPRPAPVGVFWDIENCQVPRGLSALVVVAKIRQQFFSGLREAEFLCVCDIRKEAVTVVEDLNKAQVTVVHINATSKNAADDKLRQCLRRFADTHQPPATILLISGDVNFATDLSDLRHRHGFQIILLHNQYVQEALKACAHQCYSFQDFFVDLERKTSKKMMDGSCDVTVSNLPGKVARRVLHSKMRRLSDNCGGKILSINVNKRLATIRFSCVTMAERAVKRLSGEEVFGNRVQVSHKCSKQSTKLLPRSEVGKIIDDCEEVLGNSPELCAESTMQNSGGGYQNHLSSPEPGKAGLSTDTSSSRFFDDGSTNSESPHSSRIRAGVQPYTHTSRDDDRYRASPNRTSWTSRSPTAGRHYCGRATYPVSEATNSAVYARSHGRGYESDGFCHVSGRGQEERGGGVGAARNYDADRGYAAACAGYRDVGDGGGGFVDHERDAYFRPIRPRGSTSYFSSASSSPSRYSAGSPGSPVWTEMPSTATPHLEVMVTNLDYNISAREWKKILMTTFQQQVQVLNVYIQTQSDGSNMGVVCVHTIDEARLAIAQFHRKKIGYKRIHVSLMKSENSAASQTLRSEAVALLKDANGSTLPLFKFIELFEKRFHKSVSVSELYKMKDVVTINDTEGSGRTVTLTQSNSEHVTGGDAADNEVEDIFESPVCLLHCPEGSEFYMTALDSAGLPNVLMRLRGFAPQVHTLLHSHQGSLPLMSFPACYAGEFGPITPLAEGGVPLEHLITCIPGIQVTISKSGVKKVHWSENKPTNGFDLNRFSQSPVLNQQLMQLSKEVVDLLKNSSQCRMPFSKFIPSYHHHFGRQCRVADYGYTKLAELFEAIPHVLQVMGTGNRGILTLTHRAQVKRFTTDLVRLLKAQTNKVLRAIEIPGQYQKIFNRRFDMTEYGVSYLEDMLTEIPDTIATVSDTNENMVIAIPRRDQTPEEFERTKQFCAQVIDLLRHSPQCTMPFNKFIPSYHHHFGRQCRVADYGFTKLMDLFEAIPNIIKLVDEGEEKLITLTEPELLKVLADQLMALLGSFTEKAIPATELLTQFMKFHGHSLQLQDFGVHNVIALMKKVKHVARIDDNCGVTMIRLVDRSHIQQMALNVLTMLMTSPSGSVRLEELRDDYLHTYGHSLDVSVIIEEMKPYVTVCGSGDESRVKLVTLMQFSRDVQSLLDQHTGQLQLQLFEQAYHDYFGVRLRPAAYGYPSVMALLQAIPQVVSVKGRGLKRTLHACHDFLERISHQIAYNPVMTDEIIFPKDMSLHENDDSDLVDLDSRTASPLDLLAGSAPSTVPSPELAPRQLTPRDLIRFQSPFTVPSDILSGLTLTEKLGQKTPLCQTPTSELLQFAAQYLPSTNIGKMDQAVLIGANYVPRTYEQRPSLCDSRGQMTSMIPTHNKFVTTDRTQNRTRFDFDFHNPGKALLAMISQRPTEEKPYAPFSPIDESNDHIKSVLALLSPAKHDQMIVDERERVRTLDLETPRSPKIKTLVETVVDSTELDEDKETRMDLKSLLDRLPAPRQQTSFSSSDSDVENQKCPQSPKRKPSKIVANFRVLQVDNEPDRTS